MAKNEERQKTAKERTTYADSLEESLERGFYGRESEGKDREDYTLPGGGDADKDDGSPSGPGNSEAGE